MSSPERGRTTVRHCVLSVVLLLLCGPLGALLGGTAAHAQSQSGDSAVTWDAGPQARRVGLIGDSTLSGVRWADRYGALERFSARFDAESCRRTVERSCWSREQLRPTNAMTTLRDHAGQWGEVLVMMTGYNDSADGFVEGVRAILDEARVQGIATVLWLSLRTEGVDYEEPLHRANGASYRGANRSLYALASESDGFLQVADWAGHSADRDEWFEADGAHLASPGVDALTGFIAEQLDVVLAGGNVTLDPPPWEDVRRGDEGALVVDVQRALVAAGFGQFGEVDGTFGAQTWGAVGEFQRSRRLPDDGVVDEATAVALGLTEPSAPEVVTPPTTAVATTTATTTTTVTPNRSPDLRVEGAAAAAPTVRVTSPGPVERGGDVTEALWVVLMVSPAVVWLLVRWLRDRRLVSP